MTDQDDISAQYMSSAAQRGTANSVQEFEGWMSTFQTFDESSKAGGTPPFVDGVYQRPAPEGRPLPEPKPLRRKTDDPLGRIDGETEGTAGAIMRNVAEIPGQIIAGVDDAARNALSILNPLTDWLNDHVADLRYDPVDKAKTPTGQITRKISEFLTGFIPALKGLRAAGATGKVLPPMAAGAIADFSVRDPHEGRLADIWNEMGLPRNVLTDYLASDPTDSGAEARFKNTLEGVALGSAVEGIMLGARALRASKQVAKQTGAEREYLRAKYGELKTEDFKLIGDPTKPAIEIRTVPPSSRPGAKIQRGLEETAGVEPRSVIRKFGAGVPDDFEVYVNFARIDEPDQVKFVIGKMAEKLKGTISEAQRGKITQDETARMADEMGLSVTDILNRKTGETWNAETALAARRLWASSGEKLLEAAKKAADKNAGPVDQFNFRKMMAIHSAIQAEVIGARTESARSLASWRIPAEGIEQARAIEQVMNAMGGPDISAEMARRLAILADSGATPAAIARAANAGVNANTITDAFKSLWINGLLSSPKTHAVNIMSNTLVAFQQIYERGAAGAIRGLTGGEGARMGEATAMAFGLIESIKDAFRMAAKTLKTGESGWAFNKVDLARPQAISSEAFAMSRETGLGRAVDMIGNVAGVPTRLLGAEDEFFKTIGYRMELRAQALRQAAQEGHKGPDMARRISEILDNPPEHIRISAADAALYSTFTNEVGWFGRGVMNLREAGGPVNPTILVLPFVRTPVNIARYAFERSPFAPMVGQWRADIAAGGARADLALARMSTGTAIMLTAMDWADKGLISGAGPLNEDKDVREALTRQKWQPYSVKIGDNWYSYNRTDPFGMTMGFAASITEAVKKGEIDEEDVDEWYEVAAMAIAAVSQVSISKTYLEGFSNFVETMSDPRRYSQKYIQDMVASFTPAASLNSAVKNFFDPVQRETSTPLEAVQARIAGLSKNLPPRRDLWGRPITTESGLGSVYDALSPIAVRQEQVNPIDREMVRLNQGPMRITKKPVFNGVQINLKQHPDVYDAYARLAGNELKALQFGGMGAMDYLNAVVTGKHPMSTVYSTMSDESRKEFITNTVSDFRKLAQQEILRDPRFKTFAAEHARLREIHMNSKMPVLGEPQ